MVEKRAYRFIYENSNVYKVRVFLFSLLVFVGLIALFIAFRGFLWGAIRENGIVQSIINLIHLEFTELNPGELFFTGLLGGLFFVLVPLEVVFYSSIVKGSSPILSLFMMVSGFTMAQVINYFIGLKFSPLIINFVSKKKVYETRRFINKYGSYGVFLSNLSPVPAEILTFALGITRYNVYRLFTFQILGSTIKYAAILGFALLF